jgi:hypothetical protein
MKIIEKIQPAVNIWIAEPALRLWVEGTQMPERNQVKFTQTELPNWRHLLIRYKEYVDLVAHLEDLANENNDLPF